jgi:predicted short-subunit dehydrogenase-like oxidoreductase (DUF2520 family)
MSARVFILGAGRVGTGLARAMRAAGVEVVGLHGRRAQPDPDRITGGTLPPELARATVVYVTVRDAQLEETLSALATAPLAPGTVVLHASGSAEPAALDALRARGYPAGTCHPLLPFVDPARAAANLRGAWFGVDGDAPARAAAREIATALGARALEIPPGEKVRYHAAAVFASNFPALLMASGEKLLATIGLPPDDARQALMPLFAAAAENVRERPSAQALTGPIVRGDVETVRRHLAALASTPELLALYRSLSSAAIPLAREGGADPARLAEIGALLDR